jgi:SAM-dependent methyltransferase
VNAPVGGFARLVDGVLRRSPLQRRKLEAYLAGRDTRFHAEAERFATRYGSYLERRGLSMDDAVDAYVKLCGEMMRCQVSFMRTGRYPAGDAASAMQSVYLDGEGMLSYMVGLAISQYLWESHREIFSFFGDAIDRRAAGIGSYLEIGPGHGLFLDRALDALPATVPVVAVDISPTSIDITRSIIDHFRPGRGAIEFRVEDITTSALPAGGFDFITMGEVLEHVDAPGALLRRLAHLLAPGGAAFISTCANCPAPDHVYEFRGVGEIRALLNESGLRVLDERVLPVEKLPMPEIEARRITINYCALVAP